MAWLAGTDSGIHISEGISNRSGNLSVFCDNLQFHKSLAKGTGLYSNHIISRLCILFSKMESRNKNVRLVYIAQMTNPIFKSPISSVAKK